MKLAWIPLTQNYELNESAIVTRRINNNKFDVTIGLPGWGLQNNTIAYMPLPSNINEDPEAWKSEYRGDNLPNIKDNRCFIVQLQGTSMVNLKKFRIIESCYLAKEQCWLRIPEGWEVIGWQEFPKSFSV